MGGIRGRLGAGPARGLDRTMNARGRIAVELDEVGRARIAVLRSDPPLLVRPTPEAVYLVGGAAGPLGGDDLRFEIHVAAGASLTVRTAAASMALPGPTGSASRFDVEARVGAGATLRWLPEPTIAVAGCCHRMRTVITADPGARVVWREVVVFGRHGEVPGSYRTRMDLEVADRPVLRHEVAVGRDAWGWDTSPVVDQARGFGSVLVVDPAWSDRPPASLVLGEGAAVFPLAGPAAYVSTLAADTTTVLQALGAGFAYLQGLAPETDGNLKPNGRA